MPIEAVKIPQNVYIEDRIVGPLTLRQVIISAVGCGFSYAMFSMISKAYGGMTLPLTIMVWIPGALSIIFAFVKFNDLTMFQMVLLTLERMSKAPVRVWAPRRGISITIRTATAKEDKAAAQAAVVIPKNDSRLAELSAVLDRPRTEPEPEPVATAPETAAPAAEPALLEEAEPSSLPPLPVNRNRISVSPLQPPSGEAKGEPRSRVSLFHDIHPAS